jgi:hypothetical protein
VRGGRNENGTRVSRFRFCIFLGTKKSVNRQIAFSACVSLVNLHIIFITVVKQYIYHPSLPRTMSNLVRRRFKTFKTLPLTLYRLQNSLPVSLRDHHATERADDGIIHPTNEGDIAGPTGTMTLHPPSVSTLHIAKNYRGECTVHRLQDGSTLPDGLVLLYQRHDHHYSLQTDEPVKLEILNQRMTDFLRTCPTQTLDDFVDMLEDDHDQDS